MEACTDECLALVTEGVYKVVTWSSFGVTRRHNVSGGKWTLRYCVARLHLNLGWQLKDRDVSPNV